MTREDTGALETRPVQVGNYKFTGKILGKGTFATVEEAIHIHLKVKVSVKTLNLTKCNAYVVKHLKREASILNQLNHPYILRLFQTLRFGSTYCLVTEVVTGGDLCALLRHQRGKGLGERCTKRLSRQVVAALLYLHRRGVVHRDVKLENIMLDSRKENIKLVDFGLSNDWSAESPLKTLCGSPEYSAPELFVCGTQYGAEVDMWAFGIVLYAMAVGQLPFPSASVLIRSQDKKHQFIQMINNGLSDAHVERIEGYQPEFVELLKGLVNPRWQQRLSVEDVVQDPWLSNRSRWVTERYETLDANDVSKVVQKVCSQLEVTESFLRAELKAQPCGELAGYYNIALFQRIHLKKPESWRYQAKSSTRRKTPSQRLFQTPTISSMSQNSNRSLMSSRKGTPDLNGGGDCIRTTIPQIGPFKVKNADSPSVTPDSQSRLPDHMTSNKSVKFKQKNAFLTQQILPSKLKLKTPT